MKESTSTRKEIEHFVVASNYVLKDTVSTMDPIILLRNLHPTLRAEYARKLAHEEVITEEQSKEFTRV